MATGKMIAYADMFSGISGDMFLGALLQVGFTERKLHSELAKLNLPEIGFATAKITDCGIGACRVQIEDPGGHQYRHLPDILTLLEQSTLHPAVKKKGSEVFMELARAEAKVHDISPEKVHFHEVGAIDTIVDVVGVVAGLYDLGVEKLYGSPLPMPHGFVTCSHGRLPLPAPAVCEILQNVPCYGVDLDKELVTPTGAALVKTLVTDFGPMPPMLMRKTGYGAGTTALPKNQPNLFRLVIGEDKEASEYQQVEIITTNIDDCSPEIFPYIVDTLLNKGAIDVSIAPIHMKKGRPGFRLEIISPPALSHILQQALFAETTAIGCRIHRENRRTLPREIVQITTPWGELSAKKVYTPTGARIYPEYEECARLARAGGIPLQWVYNAVRSEDREDQLQ